MGRSLYIFLLLILGFGLNAQDDIYDMPEPVRPPVVYSPQTTNQRGDDSYENIDDSYNPDYDYRYRRSLRRMYDPYYVMPSSAYLNMYTYPQFANFYNPYWGGSGFTISIGNSWGNPWCGWNSWNSWNAWNSPYYYNSWGYQRNSWGWNNWGGGWYDPYWGRGWDNRGGWNNWRQGSRNQVMPPERRISRAVRVMDPDRNYGNTTYRPSSSSGNPGWNNGNNSSNYRGNSNPSNGSSNQGTYRPSPSRMGGNSTPSNGGGSSSGGGGSSGGSRSGGRSGGASRF